MKRPKNLVEKLFGKNEVIKNVSVSCGIKDLEGDFLNYCGRNKNCYYKQVKRLEQENKELKEETLQWKQIKDMANNNKYRSALEEIRNLCNKGAGIYTNAKVVGLINEVLK